MHAPIRSLVRSTLLLATLAVAMLPVGCVGIYNNSDKFFSAPEKDLAELELFKRYGLPDHTETIADGTKVHGYRVRDVKYIILVGIYEGFDLLVEVRDGKVTETTKVPRPKTLTVLQPLPWAVTD